MSRLLILLIAGIIISSAHSETFKQRKLIIEQEFKQRQQQFQQYKTASQDKFSSYVKEHWQQFKIFKAKRQPLKPKPKLQPSVKPIKPKIEPSLQPSLLPEPVIISPAPKHKWAINFFGQNIKLGATHERQQFGKSPANINQVSQTSISDFWQFQGNQPSKLQAKLKQIINQYNFDDWAVYLLAKAVSEDIYPHQTNAQKLLHWRLLYDLGFDAKIAIAGNDYVLLLNINRLVYGKNSVASSGKDYYVFGNKINYGVSLHTLDQIPAVKKPFANFNPAQINWSANPEMIKQRQLKFNYQQQIINLNLDYDLRQVQIEQQYPAFEFKFYFAYQPGSVSQKSFKRELAPYLKHKTKLQQAQLILTMIQTSIAYQTDQQQFGREQYLFPEETLHYPYADCEDRSFLFGWLVKSIVGIDFVGLYYPNHIAVGLKINTDGDSLIYRQQKYVVADPTFIGATIGKAMQTNPQVIYASKI